MSDTPLAAQPRRRRRRISRSARIVYLIGIALIATSFLLQMLLGICPVP